MEQVHVAIGVFLGLLMVATPLTGATPAVHFTQLSFDYGYETCMTETLPLPPEPKKADVIKKKEKPKRVFGHSVGELAVALADYGIEDWQYPIMPLRIAGSGVGPRYSPNGSGKIGHHKGQDIGCRMGERIYAAADGVVRYSMFSESAGNYIAIQHTEYDGLSLETRYLHLSRLLVKRDATVQAGQVIGYCGNTGQSTSAHLHFEVKVDDVAVSPFRLLTSVEKDAVSQTDSLDDLMYSVL